MRSISISNIVVTVFLALVFFAWRPVNLVAFEAPGLANSPNVVVFFIDDLGYTDLGCYGSTFYETPNVDSLAKHGVRMTSFYSANPVCSPTRAALMTGKAPQRVGVTQWLSQPSEFCLPETETTIGEAFQAAGYRTGYLGKWHLGDRPECHPTKHGFEFTAGVNRAGSPGSYFFPYKRKVTKRDTEGFHSVPDFEDGKEGDYLTDRLTDRAIAFIENSEKQDKQETSKPFFLLFGHYAVHTPIQSPPNLVEKYQAKRESTFTDTNTLVLAHLFNSGSRARQDDPAYAAMIENLDTNVGRVVDKLTELELLEDTIIVFTSDNGGLSTLGLGRSGPTSCLPLRAGKGWTYEGGIRIPTIVSWKGKLDAGETSAPGITMDIYPTLIELAGLSPQTEQCVDGKSLASFIKDVSKSDNNRFLAWTYPHHHGSNHRPSQAARQGDWKLVRHIDEQTQPEDRIELYNLADDIGESKNVADQNLEEVQNLVEQLDGWLKATKE
jgi:arylsulfatase A-like enzyme